MKIINNKKIDWNDPKSIYECLKGVEFESKRYYQYVLDKFTNSDYRMVSLYWIVNIDYLLENSNLVLKNGYCYFSSFENKEQKLKTIYEILDVLAFFHHFNPFFDVGVRFTLQEIQEKEIDDVTLKIKLDKMKNVNDDTLSSSIKSLVLKLEKRGFVSCEDEYLQRYIVLDSISYLNEFFEKIEIKE